MCACTSTYTHSETQTLMSFDKLPTALCFSVNLCFCVMLLAPLRALKEKTPNQPKPKTKAGFVAFQA